MPRRPVTIERIEHRARRERQFGEVYGSISELLEDEEMEERGVSRAARKERRRKRLAVIGAQDAMGSEVVSDLANKDFDVIAFVEKIEEAAEVLKKVSEALKEYKGTGLKIVADKLDDEDKATELFSKVSQVIKIWEARKAYFESREAGSYFETSLRPSLILANACKRSGVDRVVFALHEAAKAGLPKDSLRVLSRPGSSLTEEAIKQNGVPYVVARFPSFPQDKARLDTAVSMISHIVSQKGIKSKELQFAADKIEKAELEKIGASRAQTAQALSKAFLLRAVGRAKVTAAQR